MNAQEFADWIDYHAISFPTLYDKIIGNDQLQAAWLRSLRDVPLGDAKAATDAMVSGDLIHPAAYEWDRLPSRVISHSRELANKRWHERQHQMPDNWEPPKGVWDHVTREDASCSAGYRAYMRLAKHGYDHNDCCVAVRVAMRMARQHEIDRHVDIENEIRERAELVLPMEEWNG